MNASYLHVVVFSVYLASRRDSGINQISINTIQQQVIALSEDEAFHLEPENRGNESQKYITPVLDIMQSEGYLQHNGSIVRLTKLGCVVYNYLGPDFAGKENNAVLAATMTSAMNLTPNVQMAGCIGHLRGLLKTVVGTEVFEPPFQAKKYVRKHCHRSSAIAGPTRGMKSQAHGARPAVKARPISVKIAVDLAHGTFILQAS